MADVSEVVVETSVVVAAGEAVVESVGVATCRTTKFVQLEPLKITSCSGNRTHLRISA